MSLIRNSEKSSVDTNVELASTVKADDFLNPDAPNMNPFGFLKESKKDRYYAAVLYDSALHVLNEELDIKESYWIWKRC